MEPISGSLIAAATRETVPPIKDLIKRLGQSVYNKLTSRFELCFQGHVEATYERCSKIKNVLYKDESVDLQSQYVSTFFSTRSCEVSDSTVLQDIRQRRRILICGTAGAGKTVFMRWCTIQLIRGIRYYGFIPLYLEMRYFDEASDGKCLENYIHAKTSAIRDAASFEQFEEGLKSGLFIIFLDAIDEIRPSLRESAVSAILKFMQQYPECGLVVSSRFDDKLQSIQEFTVFKTMPMKLTQIVSVIEKIEYNKEVKTKLIDRLNNGLYDSLRGFLSNPLLATIMLITYDHTAEIPTKLTAFYQQAFEALYQRHDAAKGAYSRDHYSELPIDRFQKIFSTFSFQTYLDYRFRFSDEDLSTSFREACGYNEEAVDPELVKLDAMQSVCLIQKDGLQYIFSHRSFQEYFCAVFISRYREANVSQLVEAIASMDYTTPVLTMLYEISPEIFEYEWVLPKLEKFLSDFGTTPTNSEGELQRRFALVFDTVTVSAVTGAISVVSWPSRRIISDETAAGWMAAIRSATDTKIQLYRSIFLDDYKLWENFEQFLDGIPELIRPSYGDIQMREEDIAFDDKEAEKGYRLEAEDATWLIYSKLPYAIDSIRFAVEEYCLDIIRRRDNRRASVNRLLVRPARVPI